MYVLLLDLRLSYSTFVPVIDHRGIKFVDPGGSEEEEQEMEEEEMEEEEMEEEEKEMEELEMEEEE